MELLILIGRTAFFYFFVLLVFRFMGKREIGELSVMDLIVFFMMSEVATIAIEKDEVSWYFTRWHRFDCIKKSVVSQIARWGSHHCN